MYDFVKARTGDGITTTTVRNSIQSDLLRGLQLSVTHDLFRTDAPAVPGTEGKRTFEPRVIVPLGKFAAQSLLRTSDPITRLRGREYKYRDAILMPTYHPAYLLRTPSAKREVWEDMKRVKALLSEK